MNINCLIWLHQTWIRNTLPSWRMWNKYECSNQKKEIFSKGKLILRSGGCIYSNSMICCGTIEWWIDNTQLPISSLSFSTMFPLVQLPVVHGPRTAGFLTSHNTVMEVFYLDYLDSFWNLIFYYWDKSSDIPLLKKKNISIFHRGKYVEDPSVLAWNNYLLGKTEVLDN